MKRTINIQNELAQLSTTLANVPFVNVYSIPVNYFESLPIVVMAKLPNHRNLGEVPVGYFEKLPDLVLNKIKLSETEANHEELPDLLRSLQKVNVYKVPDGYFDSIRLPVKEAKVINIQKKRFANVWKMAAAACVISVISFVSYKLISNQNKNKVDAKAIAAYDKIKNLDTDKEIEKLNEKDVDTYFCDAGLLACNEVENEKNLEDELEDLNITNEEIETLFETPNN